MAQLLEFSVEGEKEVEKALTNLRYALDTRAILDEGSAVLLDHMRARFLSQQAPDGSVWPVSQAALRRQRLNQGGGTLFASGRLFRSLQLFADTDTSRAIGTNATSSRGYPYPIVHQFGLHQVKRIFLGFNDYDAQTMLDVVLHRIQQGWQ